MFASKIKGHVDTINAATAAISAETASAKIKVVRAIKGNSRFKDTSVWVQLPSGNFKHVQSGKTTKASRLAGYTEVAYEL